MHYYRKQSEAPLSVTCRELIWDEKPQADLLRHAWPDEINHEDRFALGDPRIHCRSKYATQHLAIHNNILGVVSEVELQVCESEDPKIHASGTVPLSPTEFERTVQYWKKRLAEIQRSYPQSKVFLASHKGTYDYRLYLCAYTPLCWDGDGYTSPYAFIEDMKEPGEPSEITKLDTALNNIAYRME
ncbi:hypothetical protein [Neptuniibacter sp. QD37_11]|uniref:hypothetical protein n=1 Tax=Neptuniibacter sp. QD37_11 TaxID=3398209 RepID=UPI0039F62D89